MNDVTRPVPKTPKEPAQFGSQEPVSSPQPVPMPALDLPVSQEPPKLLEPPKKRSWLKWFLAVALALFVLLVGAVIAVFMWYQSALEPVSTTMENKNFKIAEGSSIEQIANGLESAGLVKSALATQIYMRLNQQTGIKAGNYVLSPDQNVAQIVQWLNEGRIDTLKVTILPGRTLKDLKKDLGQYGFSQAELEAALNKKWDHPIFADKPADVNNEGYIYPETYFMEASATAEDVVLRSLDEFEKQIEQGGYKEKLKERGFNLHQGITLASIIGKEVSSSEDMRKVSQVFQTRLKDGMVLGSDPTYIYAADMLGVPASPALDSPYNTRKVGGLPPGAVANFNLSALESVINPANTTYLFFVAGDDGVTHYSYTFAEHESNIAKYCHRACAAN